MSRRVLARAAGLLATGVGACLVLTAPQAAAVPSRTALAGADQAVQTYGGCVKGQHQGELLLLIDESGSLASTDPTGARVAAAQYLLSQLAAQTDRVGVHLDVQIAGFARAFDPNPTAWTPLTPQSLPSLVDTVSGFRTRTSGDTTDYWTALDGARRSLADRARATGTVDGAQRCQAIAWFTDGKLDIEPSHSGSTVPYADGVDVSTPAGAAAAQQAAVTSLCRPKGLADQIRSAHVQTFAVGLAPQGTPDDEFDLLRAIATGSAFRGGPCGALTDPVPGTFQKAADLDALLRAFDDILGQPDITTTPTAVCARADTTCHGQEFVLDESLDGVHILGQVDGVSGAQAELVTPDGVTRPLSVKNIGATTQLPQIGSGPAVTYSWKTDRTVVIDATNPSGGAPGWSGLWALRFVDPAASTSTGTAHTSIHVWGNILPAWVNVTPSVASGSTLPDVQLGLIKDRGASVDPLSLHGTIDLSASLIGPDGKATTVAQDLDRTSLAAPVALNLSSVPPGQATLHLTLELTTAPTTRTDTGETIPGTRLSPQEVDVPLTVESPEGATVGPVDFGVADGTAEQTASMLVTGPGCVWLPGASSLALTATPDGVSQLAVTADGATSQQSCVRVAEGQTATVTLHITADRPGNGTAAGTLPVHIASAEHPERQQTVLVPFTADFSNLKPINFLAGLIAALLLGPGIPLGLLYLVKWLTARIPDRGLYAQLIPVTVQGDRVVRDGTRFAFHTGDFNNLVPTSPGGNRQFDVGDVRLRARTGWSPFGPGYVRVEPSESRPLIGASSTDPTSHGRALSARLPLAVHNTWVVLHDPAGPLENAELLVLVGSEATAERRVAVADQIQERMPDLHARLVARRPGDGHAVAPPGGFGGWDPSQTPVSVDPANGRVVTNGPPADYGPTTYGPPSEDTQGAPYGWNPAPGNGFGASPGPVAPVYGQPYDKEH